MATPINKMAPKTFEIIGCLLEDISREGHMTSAASVSITIIDRGLDYLRCRPFYDSLSLSLSLSLFLIFYFFREPLTLGINGIEWKVAVVMAMASLLFHWCNGGVTFSSYFSRRSMAGQSGWKGGKRGFKWRAFCWESKKVINLVYYGLF